jgi:hypothetical protein
MALISFSIDSYSKNDLKAAPELELLEGDLVLRDRGYLTHGEIHRHIEAKADCIYRHKTGKIYLDPITEKPIDLLKLLQENSYLDQTVMLNDGKRTYKRWYIKKGYLNIKKRRGFYTTPFVKILI